jgi:hypothetical protein
VAIIVVKTVLQWEAWDIYYNVKFKPVMFVNA